MHAKIRMAFFVADSHFLRTYGMGMVLPWPYYVSNLIRRRYLIKASTLNELARNIKVNARALHHTVEVATNMLGRDMMNAIAAETTTITSTVI